MKIEAGKEYVTKNGQRVRIYADDGSSYRPLHGAYWDGHGWLAYSWNEFGKCDYLGLNIVSEWKETKKVKLEAWLTAFGELVWVDHEKEFATRPQWRRVPSEDKVIEVEE